MNIVVFGAAATVAIAAVAATATLGSQYTQQSVQSPWYSMAKPSWAPPNWVFPVVWTTLYICLAVAFTLSILRDTPFPTILHVVNLALNVAWCRAFFGLRRPLPALGILVGNVAVAAGIVATTRVSVVQWLLAPYIAWLLFATTLNGAFVFAEGKKA